METTLRNMYVIVGKRNYPDYRTISSFRRDCIRYFLEGTTMTWKEAKKHGFKCVKVDVIIQSQHNNGW